MTTMSILGMVMRMSITMMADDDCVASDDQEEEDDDDDDDADDDDDDGDGDGDRVWSCWLMGSRMMRHNITI